MPFAEAGVYRVYFFAVVKNNQVYQAGKRFKFIHLQVIRNNINRGISIIQKAIGVENVLQLKAAQRGFAETNLTVITADGSLYPYVLNYTDASANLNLVFSNPQVNPQPIAVFAKDATTDEVAKKAKEVSGRDRMIKGIRDNDYDVVMDLKGIYIHNDVLYFQLSLQNHSAINYDIQSLRFFIHDKKRSKRTASQEIEMQPTYILGNIGQILHASEQTVCVALPKFTIPDKKYLAIQLMEKNGGRHLSLKIKNKLLVHSSALL